MIIDKWHLMLEERKLYRFFMIYKQRQNIMFEIWNLFNLYKTNTVLYNNINQNSTQQLTSCNYARLV